MGGFLVQHRAGNVIERYIGRANRRTQQKKATFKTFKRVASRIITVVVCMLEVVGG